MARGTWLAFSIVSLTFISHLEAQDCRDATGEPIACAAIEAPVVATYAPPPEVPAVAPAPVSVEASMPASCEASTPAEDPLEAYVSFDFFVDVARPAGLSFTQVGADRAPELAREAVLSGMGEVAIGGVSMAIGVRPYPWLRIPEFRLSFGGGDYDDSTMAWQGASSEARLHGIFAIRAELAGGFEIPIDDVSIFALGHIALAGYFVEASLLHPVAGDLGVQTLAEDAWEAGWTVGVAMRLDTGFRMGASYRHVHTGAEADQVRFSMEIGL